MTLALAKTPLTSSMPVHSARRTTLSQSRSGCSVSRWRRQKSANA
jgi:hypothetical protein